MPTNQPKSVFCGIEIDVKESPAREAVINRLFEVGAGGVEEAPDGRVRAYFEESEVKRVLAGFETYLLDLQKIFPGSSKLELRSWVETDTAWAEKYKEFFHAGPLTHTFYLVPAWEVGTPVPSGMIPLVIEPGLAFGTGLHESTRLSLKAWDHIVKNSSGLKNWRVLDVGTGSGILAIAAEKSGVAEVVGVDIDELSIDSARDNLVRNACRKTHLEVGSVSEKHGTFDVIFANILLETHLQIFEQYSRALKPRGHLILSGLLANQSDAVKELGLRHGFEVYEQITVKEWSAFLLTRHTA